MAAALLYAALLLQAGCLVTSTGVEATTGHRANPIRKVVNMLQRMQEEVTKEGKEKEKLFDKYMCYCNNADETLGKSIAEAEEKIPQVESALKEGTAEKEQLNADIKKATADRAEAQEALNKAKALHDKQGKESSAEVAELESNIEALSQAIPAIEKGMGSAFLQTSGASVLRRLSVSVDMASSDRDMLAAFLSSSDSASYEPKSGEILGILKQMKDTMEKDLVDLKNEEQAILAQYEELTAAKTKEIEALTKEIESKSVRVGELSVKLAEMENDLEDTKEGLEEDKKFLADLDKNCQIKQKEWEAYKKIQAEELLALADTIKVLNDDDALELFKKTLPSAASFVQVRVGVKALRKSALQVLQGARKQKLADPRLDLLEMALHGSKVGFDKIIVMIDELVAVLKKEQEEDESKKEYCDETIDQTEDTIKVLEREASDLEKAVADAQETVQTLEKEIAELVAGIKALDESVEKATTQRKEEHEEYVTALADNTATADLLAFAKNRLNKFYNPKLYKAPPKRELSEEDRITENFGGVVPTDAPGGIAGTGIGANLMQVREANADGVAPPPPPEANLAYKKKGESSNGVIAMIDLLVKDIEKDSTEMEVEEKDAQQEYEKFMADAKEKRAVDSKSIADKEGAKAEAEQEVQTNKQALKDKKTEVMESGKVLQNLHGECDWLLKFFDQRKEARTGEIESLSRAKDVLNGADYSLLQRRTVHRLLRGAHRSA